MADDNNRLSKEELEKTLQGRVRRKLWKIAGDDTNSIQLTTDKGNGSKRPTKTKPSQ